MKRGKQGKRGVVRCGTYSAAHDAVFCMGCWNCRFHCRCAKKQEIKEVEPPPLPEEVFDPGSGDDPYDPDDPINDALERIRQRRLHAEMLLAEVVDGKMHRSSFDVIRSDKLC